MSARRTALGLVASAAFGALAMVGIVACTDFDAPDPKVLPDVEVADPSFAGDIMPIFEARCATAGCHTTETHQHNLAFEPLDVAHENARIRSNPANPPTSFLVQILRGPVAGFPRMPLGQPPLTENQIRTITNWIADGTPKN